MLIGVTGANGCLGNAVVESLLTRKGDGDFKIRALFRRSSAKAVALQSRGVEIYYGSLEDPQSLRRFVQGLDQVVHCAALTKDSEGLKRLRKVNVEGSLRLASLAVEAGLSHFLHISTAAVYGEGAGRYAEDSVLSSQNLRTRYAKTKLQAEIALREFFQGSPTQLTICRPTILFGPDSSWTLDPLRLIARGIPIAPSTDTSGDFVWVQDVAQAVVTCLSRPEAWGHCFNLGGLKLTWKDYYQIYGDLLGKAVRRLPRIFFFLSRFLPTLGVYRQLITQTREYPIEEARRYLDYRPATDVLEARERLTTWLKRSPSLLRQLRPRFATPITSQTFIDFQPQFIARPKTESEIQDLIQHARKSGKAIRARGAMHSFSPLYVTDDILLDLSHFKGVVDIGPDWVRVRGGTALTDLMQELRRHRKCLATHGAIKTQSVAGATSTGTHGCSLQQGSLSSKIREITLIDGRGEKRVLKSGSPELALAQIGLGALGIIVEVVLEITELFHVEETTVRGELEDLTEKSRLAEIFSDEEYGLLLVYPRLKTFTHTRYRRLDLRPRRLLQKQKRVRQIEILAGKMFLPILAGDSLLSRILLAVLKWKLRFQKFPTCIGELSGILATEKPADSREYPAWDIALAIPLDRADAALKVVLDFLDCQKKRAPYHNYLAPMIQLRPQAEETAILSATRGGARVWFEIWLDQRAPSEAWQQFLAELHRRLARFEYRVHWGKNTPLEREYLNSVYPELPAFRKFRSQLDPERLFRTRHLAFLEENQDV